MLDQVLRTALYVYMDNYGHSLPTLEEVLICYPFTTAEEVWHVNVSYIRDAKRVRLVMKMIEIQWHVQRGAQGTPLCS